MDDPWGSNAWFTEKETSIDTAKKTLDAPRWNTFERDADEHTVDVGEPTWSTATRSGWVEGTNLWHAESSSTLNAWKAPVGNNEVAEEEDTEPEEDAIEEQAEEAKDIQPRPTLPTPPLSPLPVPSPPSVTPPVVETPPQSPPRPVMSPPSPDPFGSFESAEVVNEELNPPPTWIPKTPQFPSEAANEPWGAAWGGDDNEDETTEETLKDEWELAQQARQKRDRKVPPEHLASLVTEWYNFAKELYPEVNSDGEESQSWRKGLDSVDGLTDLVDSFIPTTTFPPPPPPFSKTAVAKAVKETIRLTRSFALTQSSPMAHLYASKGSTDWERSVKAQKTAAHDEWGWDLKHEPEESEPVDAAKDKKSGGLLSFWSRRASSIPSTPTSATDSSSATSSVSNTNTNQPKSPPGTGLTSKPGSPAASVRPSMDASVASVIALTTSSRITSPATATAPPSVPTAADTDSTPAEGQTQTQPGPSVVSRFLNRFSRKPSATAVPTSNSSSSDKERHASLGVALSENDFSFLSDMAPSTSDGSGSGSLSHRGTASAGSLEAMLFSSTNSNSKLPPPLAPPPAQRQRPADPKSQTSDASADFDFDSQIAEAQLMDLLEDVGMVAGSGSGFGKGKGSGRGYAPVSASASLSLDLDSPVEMPMESGLGGGSSASASMAGTLPTVFRPSAVPSPMHPQAQPLARGQTAVSASPRFPASSTQTLSHIQPQVQGLSRPTTPALSPVQILPPPLPPPQAVNRGVDMQYSSAAAIGPFPPVPPPRPPSTLAPLRFDNPLPPTPKRDFQSDFSDFLSASAGPSTPPRSAAQLVPSSSTSTEIPTPSTGIFSSLSEKATFTPDDSADFGDFGDFISTPVLRTPSPPKAPRKTSRAANHKPTLKLVENAAARPGRWPAPPSPTPQPLAPPPGPGTGSFNRPPMQQAQLDFLSGDNSPARVGLTPSQPPPLFVGPPSRPALTSFRTFSPPPPSAAPTSRSATPVSVPPKPVGTSGLSAQDLSFFEGL